MGRKAEDIQHTITVGVRSTAPNTRQSQMPSFGRDAILKPEQVDDLTEYVCICLAARPIWPPFGAPPSCSRTIASFVMAPKARAIALGAPNLTDNEWLYGSSREDIHDQIWNGHGGVMPTWGGRFVRPKTIKSLAIYVHNLGGGE